MAIYKVGRNEKKSEQAGFHDGIYSDIEKEIANRGYILEFFSIPNAKTVQFKALLTQFSDKYDSSWDESMYYGRMDPIAVFKGTKRSISIGWSIVAASDGEAKDNLRKISLLVSMLYPSYEDEKEPNASSIASSPLFKLSFANLVGNSASGDSKGSSASVTGLVGKISNLAVTPNLDAGMFDGEIGKLYPKEYTMTFDYLVFHTHRVGWKKGKGEFFVPKFPYGIEHFGDAAAKPKVESKDNKTTQQKQASVNKITKGGRN
ncbi:MAG: hypothetical protein Q8P81_02110 [Nanoarchaeota archaeon]|nr:hypothetical protein [Nanoarchaeota archaeon]